MKVLVPVKRVLDSNDLGRGIINAQRAAEFAAQLGVAGPGGDDLAGQLAGQPFEVPVCFVYQVNADGLIDRVNEYAAMPPLPTLG